MRKLLYVGLALPFLSQPALAEPNWDLLEQGATVLGEARGWVETCESEQLDRFEGLMSHVRQILEDAGLEEHEIFRFEAKLETSAKMMGGESGPDCDSTEARGRIGEGVQLVNQGVTESP